MAFNYKLIDELLDAIFPLPKKFGIFLDEEGTDSDFLYFSNFKQAVSKVDPCASICYGVSKMVITSPNLQNIVIKIPFNGYFLMLPSEDEWYPFSWAAGSDSADYCLTEYEKYNKLKTYDLDCFVAKIAYYKTIDGYRIFLQEEVIPKSNSCNRQKPSKKSQDLADKWYKEGKFYMDSEWIANCLDKYGKSKVKRFLKYCTDIDLDILEDMHSGNFGYRKDGTPCILDYSNFLE